MCTISIQAFTNLEFLISVAEVMLTVISQVALVAALFFLWRRKEKKKKNKPAELSNADIGPGDKKDKRALIDGMDESNTTSSNTVYGSSGVEDGSVMSRLATGSTFAQTPQTARTPGGQQFKDNRIHEMDSIGNFHEMDSVGSTHE